jgi:hypothetical protein
MGPGNLPPAMYLSVSGKSSLDEEERACRGDEGGSGFLHGVLQGKCQACLRGESHHAPVCSACHLLGIRGFSEAIAGDRSMDVRPSCREGDRVVAAWSYQAAGYLSGVPIAW